VNDIKNVILSLCILLTGCGEFIPVTQARIDPVLLPYIELYQLNKYAYKKTYEIKKIDAVFFSYSGLDGLCKISNTGYRIIEINPEYWFNATENEREVLIYHEMGHCDLNLNHSETYSIMYPYGITGSTFGANKSYYLNLLFNEGR